MHCGITSNVLNIQPSTSICDLGKLVDTYENVIADLIDKYAPMKTRLVNNRPKAPWMNEGILKEKRIKRKYERKWRATKLPQDKEIFKVQKKKYDTLLRDAHTRYLSSLVMNNVKDPKSLFKIINELLNGPRKNKFPEHISDNTLAAICTNLKDITYPGNGITAEQKKYVTTLNSFKEVTESSKYGLLYTNLRRKVVVLIPYQPGY